MACTREQSGHRAERRALDDPAPRGIRGEIREPRVLPGFLGGGDEQRGAPVQPAGGAARRRVRRPAGGHAETFVRPHTAPAMAEGLEQRGLPCARGGDRADPGHPHAPPRGHRARSSSVWSAWFVSSTALRDTPSGLAVTPDSSARSGSPVSSVWTRYQPWVRAT